MRRSVVNGDPLGGISLAALLKKVGVTSKGKYVAFETAFDPEQMPGQKSRLMGGEYITPMLRV